MRLIDLDEIEYFTLVDKFGTPRYRIEIGEGLPIVEAIPIEWIKKQAFKHPHLNRNLFYQMIIEQWEEENGKQD